MAPSPEREIKIDPKTGVAKLQRQLENADKLLKIIGTMIVRDARQAFNAQEFGDFTWPQKYPNQEGDPNFISIAGLVQDFSEGETKPRPETLEPRPAGQRTGALQNSIAYKVDNDSVEVGSAVPYATLFQTGGVSEMQVTDDVKDKIEEWLEGTTTTTYKTQEERWMAGDFSIDNAVKGKKGKSANEKYRKKLDFLLYPDIDILETEVNQRPFIGITSRRSEILSELLSDFMAGDLDV